MKQRIREEAAWIPNGDDSQRLVVDGDVTVQNDSAWDSTRFITTAAGTEAFARNSQQVVVEGSASVAALGMAMGVSCEAYGEDATAEVTVGRNIAATGAAAWGINQEAEKKQGEIGSWPQSIVSVEGDVTVTSRTEQAHGIRVVSYAKTSTVVRGNVDVTNLDERDEGWLSQIDYTYWNELVQCRDRAAVGIQVIESAKVDIGVRGDVRARGLYAAGIELNTRHSAERLLPDEGTHITIGGKIIAEGVFKPEEGPTEYSGDAMGIFVWPHDGGNTLIRVGGIVVRGCDGEDGETMGIQICGASVDPGCLEVQVLGDVVSDGRGIVIESKGADGDPKPQYVLLVEGTLVCKGDGICVGSELTDTMYGPDYGDAPWGDVDMTAWRILVDEDHEAVVCKSDLAQSINYIVRVEQPLTGATIRLLSTLERKHFRGVANTYDVAHEGDCIRFAVDVWEGYQLKAVYGVKGGEALAPEHDGSFQAIVPRGGGVHIRAEVASA